MFLSRVDAGRKLAQKLIQLQIRADLVLGLVRGGVIVADEISQNLKLPLDILVVKKLGAPSNSELAIGAVAQDGVVYVDKQILRQLRVDKDYLQDEIQNKSREIEKLLDQLRAGLTSLQVRDKRIILVDDGIATGASTFAAIQWLKKHLVRSIFLAVPVAPQLTVELMTKDLDRNVVLETPSQFASVGQFYKDFAQVENDQVRDILQKYLDH